MKKYYLAGICGISMSALAIILAEKGENVCGNDISKARTLPSNIKIVQKYEDAIKNCDVFVASSAINEKDKQIILAKKYNKKILSRGELLGEIASDYEKVVAVAGSHGKTTTTAMIYNILKVAGKNPTLHLGGILCEEKTNVVMGGKEFFVTEACEYHNNFLFLNPYLSVITNIEPEHLDFFKTFENQKKSFQQFEKNSKKVIKNDKNYTVSNILHDKNGNLQFDLNYKDEKIMNLHLQICEDVNTENCISAYLACKELGISDCYIKLGLESFKGVESRFEKVPSIYPCVTVVDYAHHPTEIQSTIQSAKRIFKDKTIIFVFQPHTYSRTKNLLKEFINLFKNENNLILFQTYPARESEEQGISAKQLTKILANPHIYYFDNVESLHQFLLSKLDTTYALIFIGAGDLPQKLKNKKYIKN